MNPLYIVIGKADGCIALKRKMKLDNMKKTRLNGYICGFGVHYDAVAVADILDIHKYLMKNNNII